jgi:hypothetical protein
MMFWLSLRFCLVSFFKISFVSVNLLSFFIRPEDRALLESNPSAVARDDGGAGLDALPLFFLPLQIPSSAVNSGGVGAAPPHHDCCSGDVRCMTAAMALK